jgi:hypothetical protein
VVSTEIGIFDAPVSRNMPFCGGRCRSDPEIIAFRLTVIGGQRLAEGFTAIWPVMRIDAIMWASG